MHKVLSIKYNAYSTIHGIVEYKTNISTHRMYCIQIDAILQFKTTYLEYNLFISIKTHFKILAILANIFDHRLTTISTVKSTWTKYKVLSMTLNSEQANISICEILFPYLSLQNSCFIINRIL